MLFVGCSSHLFKGEPRLGKNSYSYVDESGSFSFIRESKLLNQKLVTRNQLVDNTGSGAKILEKSVLLSRVGSIQTKNKRLLTVRPEASEYTVWMEGKKYFSRMQINPSKKSMTLFLDSPESKWKGNSEIPFPKGKYFCFFNQIPECLYHNYLLSNSKNGDGKKMNFFVIWDNYPYISDLLTAVGGKLFAPASVKFDGEINHLFRYIVEIENQVILYQFSKSFDLVKVAWISQGITIAPPGQEIAEDE
jgi:hypothetical protein